MEKNHYQVQQSTDKYCSFFWTLSDENMKMGCHVIFSCRDLTSFLGVTEHTDYTESRAIPPKISRSFQFKKNFITREIRRKSRHFPSRHTTSFQRL